jgi:hypothetical protein
MQRSFSIFFILLFVLFTGCASTYRDKVMSASRGELIQSLPEDAQRFIQTDIEKTRFCVFPDGLLMIGKNYSYTEEPVAEIVSSAGHHRYLFFGENGYELFGRYSRTGFSDRIHGEWETVGKGQVSTLISFFPFDKNFEESLKTSVFMDYANCGLSDEIERGDFHSRSYTGVMLNVFAEKIALFLIELQEFNFSHSEIMIEKNSTGEYDVQLEVKVYRHYPPSQEFLDLQQHVLFVMGHSSYLIGRTEGRNNDVVFFPPSEPWRMYKLVELYMKEYMLILQNQEVLEPWRQRNQEKLRQAKLLVSRLFSGTDPLISQAAEHVWIPD